MKVNYLDPALLHGAGHHFEWCRAMVDLLVQRGHEVTVYARKTLRPDVQAALSGQARVEALFSLSPYEDPLKFDPVCGELASFVAMTKTLPAELRQVGSADAWLWPTLFPGQFAGLSMAPAVEAPIRACVHFPEDFPMPRLGRDTWRFSALQAAKRKLDIRLGVTIPELAEHYREVLVGPLPVLPVPVDGQPETAPKQALRRIGFFGHQNARKGIALLPQLASQLRERGFDVVLQDSSGHLKAAAHLYPGCELLGYVKDFGAEIRKCDLVIAPYDAARYRVMASGLVWETVAHGIPVIVPAGTAGARLVQETQGGVTTESFDVAAVLAAVDQCAQDYPRIAEAAWQASAHWNERNGLANFVDALLALEHG